MSTRGDCTCHMDGSYITNCPIHGERERALRDAKKRLGTMTTGQLQAFAQMQRQMGEQLVPAILTMVPGFQAVVAAVESFGAALVAAIPPDAKEHQT